MIRIPPRPLRLGTDWAHVVLVVQNGGVTDFGENLLKERVNITCRDCYGFGHSMKKCPSARKLNLLRQTCQIAKISISRYRQKMSGADALNATGSLTFWPLLNYFQEYIEKPAIGSLTGDATACASIVFELN